MKKTSLKIAVVLMAGIVFKLALENLVQEERNRLMLGGSALSLELRTKLGQNLAVALLSGFRGVVADFVWFDAHQAWENQIWYQLKEGIELTVVLQPNSISFWDIGAWHMAWNASHGVSADPKLPSQAYRLKAQRDWIEAGKQFLDDGIRNNPDHYDLYFKRGWLIYQKLNNPLDSIPDFKRAASYPDVPLYVSRMVGHMYVKAARTKEAYEWWKFLWFQRHEENPGQLWYKIAQWGNEAEEKLAVPAARRVFPAKKKSPEQPNKPPPPPQQRVFPSKKK